MYDFFNYLKKNEIVEDLIEFYQVDEKDKQNLIYNLVNNLKFAMQKDVNEIIVDPISYIYEKNVEYKNRKDLGEIYTPISIVEDILNRIGYMYDNCILNKHIIDISCGSGSFLIYAIKELIEHIKNCSLTDEKSEISTLDYKKVISKVEENVFGVDINPIACVLCQINIQHTLFFLYNEIIKNEDGYQFPHFRIFNGDALRLLRQNYSYEINKNHFDFVVGNPPYLFIRDIPEKQRNLIEQSDFKTNQGQYDYYQIFIELGIRLLKDQGYLGYIIPDSILALLNREVVRKYIYNNTKIKEIILAGSKFNNSVVSNVIMILQKEEKEKEREHNLIKIKQSTSRKASFNEIIQKKIKKWNYQFLVNINNEDFSILNYLNHDFPKLKDLMKDESFKITLSRGVELGKGGKIIFCKKCNKYLPLPKSELKCRICNSILSKENIEKIISDSLPVVQGDSWKPFLYSLNRFQINKYKYINIKKEGINYKNLDIYKERIVIRQLPEDYFICATYDENFSLTSQSFYNLKIQNSKNQEFNHFYLLGIINSMLMSFYFIKSFGSYKKLFPRILIEKIKNFPIKIPKTEKEKHLAKQITNCVKIRLESNNKKKEYINEIQKRLDFSVFQLYHISREKKRYIMNYLKNL
ncbi:MAG: Eco57I restriction-modification methylase domain-containing protein [Candidatus Hermodarchaeota archaeon]